jgi:hypothetical protein
MDEENPYIGALPLTPEQESRLYRVEEIIPNASAAMPPMVATDPSRWRVWPRRDQAATSSCTYQARAKAAGILREQETGEFVEYSAAAYNDRSNAPAEGSSPAEAFERWVADGVGLEVLEPSQHTTEANLAKVVRSPFDREVAKLSRVKNYVGLPLRDFDAIVSTLAATRKGIPIGIFASSKEWKRDVPEITDPTLTAAKAGVRHEICATPNFGVYEGKEGFTVEDSWGGTGINGTGVRWITRDFFEARNYIVPLYPTAFKTYLEVGTIPARPKVQLLIDLEFGVTHPDVFLLQQVYKYEGLFPANHPGSTLFHNITLDATRKFQVRYGIARPGDAGYGRVGPKTRAKINQLYS